MIIYTTVRPKYLTEYFGDAYNPDTKELRRFRDVWKLETYYHQKVNDSDLFLMIPRFSQVSLVTLLKKDRYNPIYLTVYKDKEPEDTFFKETGAICSVDDIFDVLVLVQKFSKVIDQYSLLPSLWLNFLYSQNIEEEKKSLHEITSNLSHLDLPLPANNSSFVSLSPYLMTGTRTVGISQDTYIPRYNTTFFIYENKKYYCSFTVYQVYFFEDHSSEDGYSIDLVKKIEDYVEKLLLIDITESGKKSPKLKDLEKALLSVTDASLKRVTDKDKTFYLKIEIPSSSNPDKKEAFLPIPISNKKIYYEFSSFIRLALNKKKVSFDNYDANETEISIAIETNNKFDKKDFYSRYVQYFLAQYTKYIHEIISDQKEKERKLSTDERHPTLYRIIEHLAYRRDKNIGLTMMLNYYHKYIDKSNDRLYAGYEVYEYMKEHTKISDYFSSDEETTDRIKKNSEIITANLVKSAKQEDSEKDQLKEEKIKIQKYICRSECLEEKDLKKICRQFKGKRFEMFDKYFDKRELYSLYHKLDDKCKKKIDDYFSMSVVYVSERNEDEDDNKFQGLNYDSIATNHSSNDKYDQALNSEVDTLREAVAEFSEIKFDEFSKAFKSKVNEDNRVDISWEKLLLRFLLSYLEFKDSSLLSSIKIRSYNQVLFLYMEVFLGNLNKKSSDKDYIRNVLFMLSKDNNDKNSTRVILGDIVYYDWIERFFLTMTSHEVISWLKDDGDSWRELKLILEDVTTKRNYTLCKDALPKEVKLEQTKNAPINIIVYALSIVDVEDLSLKYSIKDDYITLVKKLNTLEKKRRNKANYILFKVFLKTNTPEKIIAMYLDTTVIKPNKDDYLSLLK